MSNSKGKIVFILSGSIAAFKACAVISRLVQDGFEVQSVATHSALKFIGAATLEGLTGKPVLTDLWQEGQAMEHIHLSRWADFGILCPASAHTIAQLAQGSAGDLVTSLLLAWPKEKPFHIFPAMNARMLDNPLTQRNLATLTQNGFTVHPTQAGNLACGEEGSGRLLEPEQILHRLLPEKKGRILVTAGATRESIDGIRFLSNVSTGQTGAHLAEALQLLGWEVTYLHGQGAVTPKGATLMTYSDFKSLNDSLRAELGRNPFHAVIHAAAVSDYSVAQVNGLNPDQELKLKSSEDLNLTLKANFKILPRLKEYSSNKEIRVVGFKLTLNRKPQEAEAIARTLLSSSVDAVVANDWSTVASDRSRHPGQLLALGSMRSFTDLDALAALLDESFLGGSNGSVS